jgi:hypothetical protein
MMLAGGMIFLVDGLRVDLCRVDFGGGADRDWECDY